MDLRVWVTLATEHVTEAKGRWQHRDTFLERARVDHHDHRLRRHE